MTTWVQRLGALVPLLLLSACLLTPGKFTSTLDIRADRSFSFTYQGEMIANDFGDDFGKSMKNEGENAPATGKNTAFYTDIAQRNDTGPPQSSGGDGSEKAPGKDKQVKMTAIADALMKEEGFRSVQYLGNNKFMVDYAISGRLDHSFVFPFNPDAQAVFPFLAAEVRKDGKVRIQAPGFANSSDKSSSPMGGGMGDTSKDLDGTFTIITDAEIVSQNQEDGATTTARGKRISWKVSPLTRAAPMATLRFADATKRP